MRFLGAAMAEAGLEPEYFDGAGIGEPTPDGPPLNLFACQKGSGGGRSLLLEAHMDTVPPGNEAVWIEGPWSGRIEGGRIYGRGAHDDRIGTAMMWMIADLMRQLGVVPRGDLYYLVTTEEEFSDGGMQAYARRPDRVRPDAHLALDGNQTHWCMAGHAGALTFQIRMEGAWGSLFYRNREQETNPIELTSLLIGKLREFEAEVRRRTRALNVDPKWPEPMVAVTEVRSQGWFSNTPEQCTLRGFGNVMPPMQLGEYKNLMEQFLGEFAAAASLASRASPVSYLGSGRSPFHGYPARLAVLRRASELPPKVLRGSAASEAHGRMGRHGSAGVSESRFFMGPAAAAGITPITNISSLPT